MVRDLVIRDLNTSMTFIWEWKSGAYTNYYGWSNPHRKEHRWRNDIVLSDGVRPTAYRAYSYDCPLTDVLLRSEWETAYRPGYGWDEKRLLIVGTDGLDIFEYGKLDAMPWDASFPSSLEAEANAKVLNKLAQNPVNWGQFIAELPETLEFIAKTSAFVLEAYYAAKAGNGKRVAKKLKVAFQKNPPKSFADLWLSYQYGWKPLMTDIYNAFAGMLVVFSRPQLRSVTGVARRRETSYANSSTFTILGKPWKGCETKVTYSIDDAFTSGLNSLGLVNPGAIAWELTRLSFVVDWFIPIGNFLTAMTAPVGLQFEWGYTTKFCNGTTQIRKNYNSLYTIGTHPVFDVKVKGMDRKVLTDFPAPRLYLRPPLTPNQIASLLALITQRSR